ERALGTSNGTSAALLHTVLMLASHDLAILRGAFGVPAEVLSSVALSDSQLLATMRLSASQYCVFEIGWWADCLWWDEQLTAYGRDQIVEIAFEHPMVQHATTTVTVRRNADGAPVESRTPVSHREAFREEWLHLYDHLVHGGPCDTPLVDANEDVAL